MTTPLQEKMIVAIAEDEYTPLNGHEPDRAEDATTWQEMIINDSEDKGVFTSLLNAELVWSGGRGKDAGCGLTQKGFEVYKRIKDGKSMPE